MTTLLFSQQAIKYVKISESLIAIHYGDGSNEPVYIHGDDELYHYHLKNFTDLKKKALQELSDKIESEKTCENE